MFRGFTAVQPGICLTEQGHGNCETSLQRLKERFCPTSVFRCITHVTYAHSVSSALSFASSSLALWTLCGALQCLRQRKTHGQISLAKGKNAPRGLTYAVVPIRGRLNLVCLQREMMMCSTMPPKSGGYFQDRIFVGKVNLPLHKLTL
jgi:hypothetical protein